jgi:hypothetical protein
MDATQLISKLYLLNEPNTAPERFIKAYKSLSPRLQGNSVPWEYVLPEKVLKAIEQQQNQYQQDMENLDFQYLTNVFISTEKVFEYLQPAKINQSFYEQCVKQDTTSHVLSFKPNQDGYAKVVEYDRVSNITGRFKTVSGPMLLHLPKVYRSILKSRFTNGRIYSLDYKSLEPRILLAVNGTQPIIEQDIYETVRCSLFSDHEGISRDVIKKIVLSELYGAGLDSLSQRLPSVYNLEFIVEQINEYFGLQKLYSSLLEEWKKNNHRFITNFYGRRVKTETTHTLVNHFIQSTAVDVAMLGFKNILDYVNEIDKLDDVVPLFILHDALILDVNENSFNLINGLCKVGSVDIKQLEDIKFYMSADKDFAL